MSADDTAQAKTHRTAAPAISGRPILWRIGDGTPPDRAHVALVPGADTPLLPVDLPPRLRGIARDQVGRRMLAEQLSVPADRTEMRPVLRKGAPWTRALVADAARLRDWRSQLSGQCTGLFPDFAALPCAPGVWTFEAEGGQIRARLGPEDGFAAEPDIAAALLLDAAADGKPGAILRLGDAEPVLDTALDTLGVPVFGDAAALNAAGHAGFLKWSEAVRSLDLMAPPGADFDRLRTRIRGWAAPAVLAVLALAIWLGSVALDTRRAERRAAMARADAEALVRAHFIPSGPILDMRAQVSGALAEAQGAAAPPVADPLVLFQTAAPFLAGGGAALQTVSYRADTGLIVAVDLADFAALEALIADLRGAGFAVEDLDSGARQSGGVSARLRLLKAEA